MAQKITYDLLTKLFDRNTFFSLAQEMIAQKEEGTYRMVFVNIDSFKMVNEQYGIESGDEVLKWVGESLQRLTDATSGICARISSDNFAMLYEEELVCQSMIDDTYSMAVCPPAINKKIKLTVGRYIVKDKSLPVVSMFDRARIAAGQIKGDYEVSFSFYDDSMRNLLIKKQSITDNMEDAVANHEFVVWYQPQYNHANRKIVGVEALVRWKREGQFISPAEFIPLFEQNGFIYKLDKYVWETVCKDISKWIDEGNEPIPVSVNISRKDILHDDFIDTLRNLLARYRIDYKYMRLEITESAFAEETGLITKKANELIRLGFVVEIDDFGSGYSSLNTLKDVPASVLKLDMRFFEQTSNVQRAGLVIESTIRMAKWLGMSVIAEGVEEEAQADFLKSIGCHYIQGYYYAKPMPKEDFELLMKKSKKEPRLERLKALDTFKNSNFWDPNSLETLIFNSYVGGACIFEYRNGRTQVIRTNDQFEKAFGKIKPPEGLIESPMITESPDPEARKLFLDTVEKTIETSNIEICELKMSDGEHMEYVRVAMRVLAKTDDRVLLYSLLTNQTAQIEAEMHERNMLKQLDAALEAANAAVTVTRYGKDSLSEVLYVSSNFCNMFEYTEEEFEKGFANINNLICEEDRPKYEHMMLSLKEEGDKMSCDFRARKKDGTYRHMTSVNTLIAMDGVEGDVIVTVASDVTELYPEEA